MSDRERFVQAGDRARILLNEPWDILEALGGITFLGVVTDVNRTTHQELVIGLDEPLQYKGLSATYFYAKARYTNTVLSSDRELGMAICGFISLTDEEGKLGIAVPIPSLDSRIYAVGSLSWSAASEVPEEPKINSELGQHLFQRMSGNKQPD